MSAPTASPLRTRLNSLLYEAGILDADAVGGGTTMLADARLVADAVGIRFTNVKRVVEEAETVLFGGNVEEEPAEIDEFLEAGTEQEPESADTSRQEERPPLKRRRPVVEEETAEIDEFSEAGLEEEPESADTSRREERPLKWHRPVFDVFRPRSLAPHPWNADRLRDTRAAVPTQRYPDTRAAVPTKGYDSTTPQSQKGYDVTSNRVAMSMLQQFLEMHRKSPDAPHMQAWNDTRAMTIRPKDSQKVVVWAERGFVMMVASWFDWLSGAEAARCFCPVGSKHETRLAEQDQIFNDHAWFLKHYFHDLVERSS